MSRLIDEYEEANDDGDGDGSSDDFSVGGPGGLAGVTRKSDGMTPLMLVTRTRDSDLVDMVLEMGPDVNAVDHLGRTALCHACHVGCWFSMEELEEAGADGAIGAPWAWLAQCPELDFALGIGVADVLAHRFDEADVNARDGPKGWAAIHYAASIGSLRALDMLWTYSDHRLRIDLPAGDDGATAAAIAYEEGREAFLEELIRRGCSHKVAVGDEHDTGTTLLHWAARDGDISLARLLLDKGADVNARGLDGETPVVIALANGHDALADALMARGGLVEVADDGSGSGGGEDEEDEEDEDG